MACGARVISLLVVINNLDSGGTERHLLAVLPGLVGHGYAPAVFTVGHRGALAERFEAAGIPVHVPALSRLCRSLPGMVGRPLGRIAAALSLRALLRRRQPAVLHFFLPAAYLVGGLASLGSGVRCRVMSRRSLNDYQRKHPFAARIERWLHPRMSMLLGNSRAVVAQLMAEGAPQSRVRLLANGIDLKAFAAAPPRAAARAAIGLDPQCLVLITVANLIPYKGHADLLSALGRIRAALPSDWRLLCVGRDEGIGTDLRRQAAEAGIGDRVLWLGERADVPALLRAADVGLLCSHEEGLANAILEGMAAGLPMIATRVGGNTDAVIDGETGLLVPARSPEALGQAILALAGAPSRRAAFGRAGRDQVEREFSLDRCIAEYDALYRQLTGEPACAD